MIKAVLGATNTGKTHYAMERMLARNSGVIGLPLRLLARELYDKAVAEKGEHACALITGEEKICPPHARYYMCTVEAMPMADILADKFACVVIDEIQMMANSERGHFFTDRVLRARGTEETLLLGSKTIAELLRQLLPEAKIEYRERFSSLQHIGHLKLSRLPKRTVIVAFSPADIYSLAELMRRQYGGAALIMGSLSPRIRNAQAELYSSGEVNYMVATDAIGMGLNLDVDHVAFANIVKFDGQDHRWLKAYEIGQIAGRAGRFRNDGTFGTTSGCKPIPENIIARVENHDFQNVSLAHWRQAELDFSSLEALRNSLKVFPDKKGLRRTKLALDEMILDYLIKNDELGELGEDEIKLLWEACQIPDFSSLGVNAHAQFVGNIFNSLRQNNGRLDQKIMEKQLARLENTECSLDVLTSHLTSIRTWKFISFKQNWLEDTKWIKRTENIENNLSDALHENLVQRFIDKRTSTLLKGLGNKASLDVDIKQDGEITADGQNIGTLKGVLFTPSISSDNNENKLEAKTINKAAQALAPEINRRLSQIAAASQAALQLSNQGEILWVDEPVGKLLPSDNLLKPEIELIGGEHGSDNLRKLAKERIKDFIDFEIKTHLARLFGLKDFLDNDSGDADKIVRAIAYNVWENHGNFFRSDLYDIMQKVDRQIRHQLYQLGVVIGFEFVFMPDLIKSKPSRLLSILFAYGYNREGGGHCEPFLNPNGRTAMPADGMHFRKTLEIAGFCQKGPLYIRFDILNRLGNFIMRARKEIDGKSLRIKSEMLSLLGCSPDAMREVLRDLGYVQEFHEFTPQQKITYYDYVAKMMKRYQIIKERKIKGGAYSKEPEIEPPIYFPSKTNEKHEAGKNYSKYNSKYNRPLNDYIPNLQFDENNKPIFDTELEIWRYNPHNLKKRRARFRQRANHDTVRNYDTNRNDAHTSRTNKTNPRLDRLQDWNKAETKTDNRPAKTYTAAPKKQEAASPFAALSELLPENKNENDDKHGKKKTDKKDK